MSRPPTGADGHDDKAPLHVVLHTPEIHWNTGNIGRTCLAAGCQLHLVRPLGFSLNDKAVRRAGLDYWGRVDPTVWPNWPAFETALPNLGEPVIVTPDAYVPYWATDLRGPTVLIFGRESNGLPSDIRVRYAEQSVMIPMSTEVVRSLNLSTSVGIVVYEAVRQRST